MKLWLVILLLSASAMAREAATLSLRAHVPSVFRVELRDDGSLVTHTNNSWTHAATTVERVDKNGMTLITVIHP